MRVSRAVTITTHVSHLSCRFFRLHDSRSRRFGRILYNNRSVDDAQCPARCIHVHAISQSEGYRPEQRGSRNGTFFHHDRPVGSLALADRGWIRLSNATMAGFLCCCTQSSTHSSFHASVPLSPRETRHGESSGCGQHWPQQQVVHTRGTRDHHRSVNTRPNWVVLVRSRHLER